MTFFMDSQSLSAQSDEIPYYEIPAYPESMETGTVAARMVDGLGYRYYWASKDLRTEDLAYKPSDDARSAGETLDHLYGLSQMILNAALKEPNIRPREEEEALDWEAKRAKTLQNFKQTADIFRQVKGKSLAEHEIIFQRGDNQSTVSFWNLINGPIADAIYHTGQIVSFRRASGNPIHPGVNVFMGKTKE